MVPVARHEEHVARALRHHEAARAREVRERGVDNRLFFGDVLGVEGNGLEGEIQCTNCKSALKVNRETLRVSSKPKKGKK